MKAVDYEVVKVIGRGAFGEVQLVRIPLCVSCVANNTKYSFLKVAVILVIYSLICHLLIFFAGKTQSHA